MIHEIETTDEEDADLEAIRASRVEVPTIAALIKLEAFANLGLTTERKIEKEAAAIAETYIKADSKGRGEIKAAAESAAVAVAAVAEPVP